MATEAERVAGLEARVKSLEEWVKSLEARVDKIADKLDSLKMWLLATVATALLSSIVTGSNIILSLTHSGK